MLLYIHVPFCRRKCRYCAFYSNPLTRSGDEMAVYLSTLYVELGQWGRRLGRVPVESVFSSAAARQACLIRINWRACWIVWDGRLKCCPERKSAWKPTRIPLHTAEKASGFLAAGVNRISLGVQSLHDGMLETLGRLHRANAAREAFRAIREAGCANLSLDLMGGPGADAGAVAGGWRARQSRLGRSTFPRMG